MKDLPTRLSSLPQKVYQRSRRFIGSLFQCLPLVILPELNLYWDRSNAPKKIRQHLAFGNKHKNSSSSSSNNNNKQTTMIVLRGPIFYKNLFVGLILWTAMLIGELTHLVQKEEKSVEDVSNRNLATCPVMIKKRAAEAAEAREVIEVAGGSGARKTPQDDSLNTTIASKKPTLILHVGLPKTGTTFLQCTLSAHADVTEPILLMNNYEFVGMSPFTSARNNPCNQDVYPEQFMKMSKKAIIDHDNGEKISSDFINRTEELHKRGHNGIIIFEYAFRYNAQPLQQIADILNPLFNVEVVIAYKPYHSWLPSMFNQIYKSSLQTPLWPDQIINPRTNATAPEAFTFDLDDRPAFTPGYVTQFEKHRKHPTEVTRNNFRKSFSTVHVFPADMGRGQTVPSKLNLDSLFVEERHTIDPMLEHFLCCVVPDAPAACRAARMGLFDFPGGSNPSESLDEDILAVAAYRAGLVPPGATRSVVRRVIKDRARDLRQQQSKRRQWLRGGSTKKGDAAFVLQCLPQEKIERLEQLSLDMERQLFVEEKGSWTLEDEAMHRRLFEKSVATNKFCGVDAERTLRQWTPFFESNEFLQQVLMEEQTERTQ